MYSPTLRTSENMLFPYSLSFTITPQMMPMIRAVTLTEDTIIPAMAMPLPRSFLCLVWIRPMTDMIRAAKDGIPPNKIEPIAPKKPTAHKILFFCSGIKTTGGCDDPFEGAKEGAGCNGAANEGAGGITGAGAGAGVGAVVATGADCDTGAGSATGAGCDTGAGSDTAGCGVPTGVITVPQSGQNLASSGICIPQLGQNILSTSFSFHLLLYQDKTE